MKNFLKRPTSDDTSSSNKYEQYNLKENPFPSTPAINKENSDNRYNGEIFENKIREEEFNKIKQHFLNISQNDPNHLRIGYILDTSYIGRGNGKSAFSLNLLKTINKEYCLDISNEKNKCFGIYVSPEPSGRTKSFYSLLDLIFDSIINTHIINYCLAILRLEAILKIDPNFKYETTFNSEEDLIEKLNTTLWFETNKLNNEEIEIATISKSIFKENSYLNKLPPEFPLYRDRNNFFNPRIVTEIDFRNYYENLKHGKDRIQFVFTDLVNFFLGSGFNGAYCIVDDFERIPDFQSDRQKREFALELRTNFFDGLSQNAQLGFYNLFMIFHAGVPRLIEKAWSDTGMAQRSPISVSANEINNHIVLFEKLTTDHAVLLIKKYLMEFRLETPNKSDELLPFTKEAIKLIGEMAELNAANILQKAYYLLDKASNSEISIIDEAFVKECFKNIKNIEESSNKGIEEEESTNLFDKAKEDE